jgi:hypothetical protein
MLGVRKSLAEPPLLVQQALEFVIDAREQFTGFLDASVVRRVI